MTRRGNIEDRPQDQRIVDRDVAASPERATVEAVQDLLRTARERQAAGDVEGAGRIFEEILEREPEHPMVLHALGVLKNRQGDARLGADLLKRATNLRPSDPVRHVDLAESYRALGDHRAAIGCCLTALRLQPTYPEALNTLGLALHACGDHDAAMEQFRRASAIRPGFSPAHTNAGLILKALGAPEEALKHLRRAVDLEPHSALTRTNLGLALLEAGLAEEAHPHFREAVRSGPGLPVAHHNLGNVLRILGHLDEARASYLEAIRLDPRLALSYLHIAMTYRLEGSPTEALGWCRRALEMEPDNPEFWAELAEIHRGRGDTDDLGEALRRAEALAAVGPLGAGHAPAWAMEEVEAPAEGVESFIVAPTPASDADDPDSAPAYIDAGMPLHGIDSPEAAFGLVQGHGHQGPDPALASMKAGIALLSRGRAAQALPLLLEVVRLRPDVALAHRHLGDALRVLGRLAEARAAYLEAIRLEPDLHWCYIQIGSTLVQEGSLDEASRWYEIAVEMEPSSADYWEALADLHLKRDQSDQAVECRRRVLELTPTDRADVHMNLGWALQEDGRPDEAMEQLLIARTLQPDSEKVHLYLGGLHEEQGEMAEAEAELRTAIELRPRFTAAYARLATLLRGKLPEDDLRILEEMLADPELGEQPRARLLFALGHVMDARGDYPRAARAAQEANAISLRLWRADGVIYRPEDHERFVDRLIAAFDPDFFRRTVGFGLGTRRPIFVIGLPRSGTTLVEQILASHRRIHGAGERLFGRRAFESLPAILGRNAPPIECVASLDEYGLKRLAGEHLGKLNAMDLGRSDRIVDKLPDNYLYLGLLAAMFPEALFIHCRRDLRDVAVSCWISDFRGIRWSSDPGHIGARFRDYRRISEHWDRVLPARIVEVRYEDNVSDPEGSVRRLLDACGLEWDPACLDFYNTRRVVRTASVTQVRQPIYKTSLGRWRHYEKEMATLFAEVARAGPDQA